MAARSLAKPAQPEPISDRKAAMLCKDRDRINQERLELNRLADKKAKEIEWIDAQLVEFVEARATGKARTITLPRWRLSIVQVQRAPYYMRELVKAIGEAAFEKLKSEQGTKDKLEIEQI